MNEKMKNTADKIGGKVKEGVGDLTDDEALKAQGQRDQMKADLKQAGEKVKDAFRDGGE